jgi:hypothetical protein
VGHISPDVYISCPKEPENELLKNGLDKKIGFGL